MNKKIYKNDFFIYGAVCIALFFVPTILGNDPFNVNKSSTYVCLGYFIMFYS